MPWTLAPPIAVVPVAKFTKNGLSLLALAIGSLSPDFGYYISMWQYSALSHHFMHSLYTALPTSLIILLLCFLLRDGILQLLPPTISRITAYHLPKIQTLFDSKTLFLTVLAVIVGIWSHIFWDSFTHKSPKFAGWWPFVLTKIALFGSTFPLYKLFQNMSSLLGTIGLGFLMIRAIRQRRKREGTLESQRMSWQLQFWVLLICSAGALSIFFYWLRYSISLTEIPHFLFINAITSSNIIFGSSFLMAVLLQIRYLATQNGVKH